MSKKITPEIVEKAAASVGISKELNQRLFARLCDLLEENNDDEPKEPPCKKQTVFLLAGKLPQGIDDVALTGWVVQIKEEESPHNARNKIKDAADIFNCSKKGRLVPVQTIGEACENVPAKMFKEAGIWIKTKTPVYALPCSNELPDTPSVLGSDRGSMSELAQVEQQRAKAFIKNIGTL